MVVVQLSELEWLWRVVQKRKMNYIDFRERDVVSQSVEQ